MSSEQYLCLPPWPPQSSCRSVELSSAGTTRNLITERTQRDRYAALFCKCAGPRRLRALVRPEIESKTHTFRLGWRCAVLPQPAHNGERARFAQDCPERCGMLPAYLTRSVRPTAKSTPLYLRVTNSTTLNKGPHSDASERDGRVRTMLAARDGRGRQVRNMAQFGLGGCTPPSYCLVRWEAHQVPRSM